MRVLIIFLFFYLSSAVPNEECTVSSSSAKGLCIAPSGCEGNKNPQACTGDFPSVPFVCCPFPFHRNLTGPEPGALSQKMCDDYYDIKQQTSAIDSGEKALSKEFPHMAAIGYIDNNAKIVWLCGGSLISHYFILSAAHCAESPDYGPAKWIRLGDLDLNDTTEDANPQDIKISKTFIHPMYKPPSHYHDIALFKLEKRIKFGLFFKAACLHVQKDIPVEILEATGWGKLGILGDSSSHLMKAKLKVVNHGTCAGKYASLSERKLKDGILDQYQMCAGDDGGKDTCPGDSGGPLHYSVKEVGRVVAHFVVAGITSFGKGCGGKDTTGVYTRVSAYTGWIEGIVWREGD